jgi:uncharacterized protein YecT (DUF1311 family)
MKKILIMVLLVFCVGCDTARGDNFYKLMDESVSIGMPKSKIIEIFNGQEYSSRRNSCSNAEQDVCETLIWTLSNTKNGEVMISFIFNFKDELESFELDVIDKSKFKGRESEVVENALGLCREMDNYNRIKVCVDNVVKISDAQLNDRYRDLMGTIREDETKKKLRNAQRLWITYRDTDCELVSSAKNDLNWSYCVAEKTLVRVKEFESILEWPIGCNGCPF